MASPHHLLSSTSSSASSRSYSSNSFPSSAPQTRTFEQVWNDITLSTQLHHPPAFPGAAPIMPPHGFLSVAPPAAAADQLTVLQLRPPSPFDLQYCLQGPAPAPPDPRSAGNSAAPGCFSADVGSPQPGFFPFGGKRRPPEAQEEQEEGPDRRSKRMMKNRESAARSRARKQAYTGELEAAVNSLTQENAKLRRMHNELRVALAAQMPTKKALVRTLTAPF